MNRKEGIDYFPVKCAADKNIELVTAECGLKAHAVIYILTLYERMITSVEEREEIINF